MSKSKGNIIDRRLIDNTAAMRWLPFDFDIFCALVAHQRVDVDRGGTARRHESVAIIIIRATQKR